MLKDIHEWFVDNLKPSKVSSRVLPYRTPEHGPLFSGLVFELYVESAHGLDLVCSRASLHPKWNGKQAETIAGRTNELGPQLFLCQCQGDEEQLLHTKVAEFGCKFQFHCDISARWRVAPSLCTERLAPVALNYPLIFYILSLSSLISITTQFPSETRGQRKILDALQNYRSEYQSARNSYH